VELGRPQDGRRDARRLDQSLLGDLARVVIVRDAVDADDGEHHEMPDPAAFGSGQERAGRRREEPGGLFGPQRRDVGDIDDRVDALERRVETFSAQQVHPRAPGEGDGLAAGGAGRVHGRAAHGPGPSGNGDLHVGVSFSSAQSG
jgi:hypothetical protein